MINQEIGQHSPAATSRPIGHLEMLSCDLESDETLTELWRFRLWSKCQDLIQMEQFVLRNHSISNTLHNRLETCYSSLQTEMQRSECNAAHKALLWQWWASHSALHESLQPVVNRNLAVRQSGKYFAMLFYAAAVVVGLIIVVIYVNYM